MYWYMKTHGWTTQHKFEQKKLKANYMILFIKFQKVATLSHGDRSESHGYFWWYNGMMGFWGVVNVMLSQSDFIIRVYSFKKSSNCINGNVCTFLYR